MKNQNVVNARNAVRTLVTPAVFFLLLLAGLPANANEEKSGKVASTPVDVKYLGLYNNAPVFQMNIDNINEDDLYVTLKDEDGSILYAERIKDKRFSKKFQFVNLEASNLKVTVSLSSKNYKRPQEFEITNVSKVVQDVVVTELR